MREKNEIKHKLEYKIEVKLIVKITRNLIYSNIALRSALFELEKNWIREEPFYSHNEIKLKVKRSERSSFLIRCHSKNNIIGNLCCSYINKIITSYVGNTTKAAILSGVGEDILVVQRCLRDD